MMQAIVTNASTLDKVRGKFVLTSEQKKDIVNYFDTPFQSEDSEEVDKCVTSILSNSMEKEQKSKTAAMWTLSALVVLPTLLLLLAGCGGQPATNTVLDINPRDTVVVPDGITGEDSVAYIENAILQSPITASDLLSLAEVHSVEDRLCKYNDFERAKEYPEYADEFLATHRDSAAMRLANRFMRMGNLVNMNGNANDMLQWAVAVNAALDTFRVAVPSVPSDSVLDEIVRVTDKFSSQTQTEMNFQCYVEATVDYYRTIEAYRQWLLAVPSGLKSLMQEEYEAWYDLNEARFAFWHSVSYTQEWYSMKPMEIEGYYENLSCNRRAELEVERSIVLEGKPYSQKGTTVTTQQWDEWIAEHSVPEDIEFLREHGNEDRIPSDSLVAVHVDVLRSSFSRWLAARQAIAAALPKEQGTCYDNLTADIHCRMVGKLATLIPYETW